MSRITLTLSLPILALCVAAVGCGDEDNEGLGTGIEVAGLWADGFGGTNEVTDTQWGSQAILEYDNEANVAITQNPADDEWFPSQFSKIVWTEPTADGFRWCTVDFGLASLEAAQTSTQTADAQAPDAGCGGFSWSAATAP